jgi:hypothetical protein
MPVIKTAEPVTVDLILIVILAMFHSIYKTTDVNQTVMRVPTKMKDVDAAKFATLHVKLVTTIQMDTVTLAKMVGSSSETPVLKAAQKVNTKITPPELVMFATAPVRPVPDQLLTTVSVVTFQDSYTTTDVKIHVQVICTVMIPTMTDNVKTVTLSV